MPGLELFGDLGIWGSRLSWTLDCWVQVLGFGLRVNPGQRAHGVFCIASIQGNEIASSLHRLLYPGSHSALRVLPGSLDALFAVRWFQTRSTRRLSLRTISRECA